MNENEIEVTSHWRGEEADAELYWTIDGEDISDRELRQWVFRNMPSPDCHVDVIRHMHVTAFARRRKES